MGYSARIELWLELDGVCQNMGQIGPEWFILRDEVKAPPQNGTAIIRVDDSENRIPVFLPDGIDPEITKTRYIKLTIPGPPKSPVQKQFSWATEP